jgi:hypothetical protein
LGSGRIERVGTGDDAAYSSKDFIRLPGEEAGWEAAVLDHYQALVATIRAVLSRQSGNDADSSAGGFTYAFDIWPGHPLEDEVTSTLGRLRGSLSDLRLRVDEMNKQIGRPASYREITVYGGQSGRARGLRE